MNIYIKSIDEHQVHQLLTQTISLISMIKKLENIPVEDIESLLRAEYIFHNFIDSISLCEKQLISISWLNEVSNAMNNINNYFSNYNSSRNVVYITSNLQPQLDIVLNNTAKINTIKSKINLQGIMSSIEKYQNSVSDYLFSIENRNAQLSANEVKLSEQLSSINSALLKKAADFENTITQEKSRLDNLITNHQKQIADNKSEFQNQQKEFSDEFNANSDEFDKDFNKRQDNFNSKIDELSKSFLKQIELQNKEASALIDDNRIAFNKYQDEVKNIVGIVNTNMFSHKYKEVADDAHKRARFWHGMAIFLMLLLAGFAFYAFIVTINQDTTWVKLVAKIFAATTIATGSAYAARQASKQEKVERYSRKIEMEMVAIDPFLESLDDENKQAVKTEIARGIFGKSDSMEIKETDEAHNALNKMSSVEDAFSAIIKLIGKIK